MIGHQYACMDNQSLVFKAMNQTIHEDVSVDIACVDIDPSFNREVDEGWLLSLADFVFVTHGCDSKANRFRAEA